VRDCVEEIPLGTLTVANFSRNSLLFFFVAVYYRVSMRLPTIPGVSRTIPVYIGTCIVLNSLKHKKLDYSPIRFPKEHCFFKFSRLLSFFFLVRAACI
jgi:hypothetical protein